MQESSSVYVDPQSGLTWTRDANIPGKATSWHEAVEWVKTLNCGGYNDWRLPTVEELWSFIDMPRPLLKGTPEECCHYAWFNANGFKNVQAEWYWSGTEDNTIENNKIVGAEMVDTRGPCDGNSHKDDDGFVWPVRGGAPK